MGAAALRAAPARAWQRCICCILLLVVGSHAANPFLCPAGYGLVLDGNCEACKKGKYQAGSTGLCLTCASGQHASHTTSTTCSTCGAGAYSSEDRTACLLCPRDTTSSPGSGSVFNCTHSTSQAQATKRALPLPGIITVVLHMPMGMQEFDGDAQQRLIESIADAGGINLSQVFVVGIEVGPGASVYVEVEIAQAQETPRIDIINMHFCAANLPPAITMFTHISATIPYSALDVCDPSTVSAMSSTVTFCIIIAISSIAVTCLQGRGGKEQAAEADRAAAHGSPQQPQVLDRCVPRCYSMDLVSLLLHVQLMSLLWDIAGADSSSSAQQRAIRQLSYNFRWSVLDWSPFGSPTYRGCSSIVPLNGTVNISVVNASAYSNCNTEDMSADMLPFAERLIVGSLVLIIGCVLRVSMLAWFRRKKPQAAAGGSRVSCAPSGTESEVTPKIGHRAREDKTGGWRGSLAFCSIVVIRTWRHQAAAPGEKMKFNLNRFKEPRPVHVHRALY